MDDKLHQVAVTGVIIKNGKYLIIRRSLKKEPFAGKWTVPGGRLEIHDYLSKPRDTSVHWYNVLEEVLRREVREEVGLKIKDLGYLTSLTFLKKNIPVIIISLYAYYDSGEVILNDESMDYAWVSLEESKNYDLIEGIYDELVMLDKLLKGEKVGEWENELDVEQDVSEMNGVEKKKIGVGFGVMMLKNGMVLLGKRHFDKDKADSVLRGEGTWTMPGGKLKYGEDFEEGAIREVIEETGIELNNVKVICVNNDKNEHAHFVTMGLFSDNFEGEPKVMEPDEITEWGWFDLDNLPKPLYFPTERVLENYKKDLFYKNLEVENENRN